VHLVGFIISILCSSAILWPGSNIPIGHGSLQVVEVLLVEVMGRNFSSLFIKILVELYADLLAVMCKTTIALNKYIGSLLYIGMRIRTKNWISYILKGVASRGVQFDAPASPSDIVVP